MPKPQTVAVLGGGVGGLSAAHELAERGFAVTVYERRERFGGKARSVSVPGTAVGGRKDLPGEHGFRFFPGFYKHITDTMKRIPFGTQGGTCADNLVVATRILLTRAGEKLAAELIPEARRHEAALLARHAEAAPALKALLRELTSPWATPSG